MLARSFALFKHPFEIVYARTHSLHAYCVEQVPRQRTFDGMKLACDRFLGERMDYDLIQVYTGRGALGDEHVDIRIRTCITNANNVNGLAHAPNSFAHRCV